MSFSRKMSLLTVVLLFVINAYSQDSKFSIGVKGGLNLSNGDVEYEYADLDAKIGYRFGVVAEYDLERNFFLRSGLDFNSKGFKENSNVQMDINGDGLQDVGVLKTSWNPIYLDIPLMLGYKIDVGNAFKINFAIGGYLAYGVGGKVTSKLNASLSMPNEGLESYYSNRKMNLFQDDVLRRFDGGLMGSVGAEYRSFTLNLGYQYGLANIADGGGDIRNRNAFLSVGYRIF